MSMILNMHPAVISADSGRDDSKQCIHVFVIVPRKPIKHGKINNFKS